MKATVKGALVGPVEYLQTLVAPIKRAGGLGMFFATVDLDEPSRMRLCISSIRAWQDIAQGFVAEYSEKPASPEDFEAAVRWLVVGEIGSYAGQWTTRGVAGFVLVRHLTVMGKSVDVYVPMATPPGDAQIDAMARSILANWPGIKAMILRPMSGLSDEQIYALQGSMTGMTAEAMAKELGISESAVSKRVENARKVLKAKSTTHGVAAAYWIGAL